MQRLSAELLYLSLAPGKAPSWVRPRVPAGAEARRRMLDALADLARERLILHTCERFEIYAAGKVADAAPWFRRLAEWLDLAPEDVTAHVELRRGDAAVAHLLRVTAGLESRLVGEPQIQGQVRQAFREAREARAVGPLLDAMARTALHAGRRARRETFLGRTGPSLVGLTLGRLREELGPLRGRSVIVAGTGSLAVEVVAALTASAVRVVVASRTRERAEALAARFAAAFVGHYDLGPALARTDALVACTHGVVPIEVPAVAGRRFPIVDLGMPPNMEGAVAAHAGVRLIRLEELGAPAAGSVVAEAERIVAEEAERFRRWRIARGAAPLVLELLRNARAKEGRASRAERHALHLQIERLKAEAEA